MAFFAPIPKSPLQLLLRVAPFLGAGPADRILVGEEACLPDRLRRPVMFFTSMFHVGSSKFDVPSRFGRGSDFSDGVLDGYGEMLQLGNDRKNKSSFIQPSFRVSANPSIVRTH